MITLDVSSIQLYVPVPEKDAKDWFEMKYLPWCFWSPPEKFVSTDHKMFVLSLTICEGQAKKRSQLQFLVLFSIAVEKRDGKTDGGRSGYLSGLLMTAESCLPVQTQLHSRTLLCLSSHRESENASWLQPGFNQPRHHFRSGHGNDGNDLCFSFLEEKNTLI